MVSYEWLVGHGCELSSDLGLFLGIFVLSGGNPCPDCGFHATCPIWREQRPNTTATTARVRSATSTAKPASRDGINCPRCGSPVNVAKARRRYAAERGYPGACYGLRCACGHEFNR